MTSIAFDTLKFVRRLKEARVPERHAEAEAEALADVFDASLEDIATMRDIKELELRIDGELKLLKWMISLLLAEVLSLILKAFFI